MTKTWNGPTPYDAELQEAETSPYSSELWIVTVRGPILAYRAAMNSPEVMNMYWELKHEGTYDTENAIAAYEAGLKETE